MAIDLWEVPNSRQSTDNPPSVTLKLRMSGTHDLETVRTYTYLNTGAVYTSVLGNLWRQPIEISEIGHKNWAITVPYGPVKRLTGDYQLSFDTTGGTVHISTSKETISSYVSSDLTGSAPDHKQLIGYEGPDTPPRGTDIVIPALKITANFRHPAGVITLPQMKFIASITGMVNSAPFLTFAAGEVLFLGASGNEGATIETQISYQFAMSANATGLSFGNIADVVKAGWNPVWIRWYDDEDESVAVKKPGYAYVERVYETTDLATALGFG